MIKEIKLLKVGDFVYLKHQTPPKHRCPYSSSIQNFMAIVTKIPKNAGYVCGRFINGNHPVKIKHNSINWKETKNR